MEEDMKKNVSRREFELSFQRDWNFPEYTFPLEVRFPWKSGHLFFLHFLPRILASIRLSSPEVWGRPCHLP